MLKREFPEIGLVGDVALDPYTDHGHDGVIRERGDDAHNDESVAVLVRAGGDRRRRRGST